MPAKKVLFHTINALSFAALSIAGIWLFFMRDEKMRQPIAHEIKVEAEASAHKIVTHQFLILISQNDVKNIFDILKPLNLHLKAPILNWLLVESQNEVPTYVDLNSKEADASRNILSALLQHPKILDAHHNFVMAQALNPLNKNFSQEWQLQTRSENNPVALQLPGAWDISPGASSVAIAVVDDFFYKDIFTFKVRFAECSQRVQLKQPYSSFAIPTSGSSLPHGELMLHALGTCANVPSFSTGIDWHAQILAIQRPAQGHAQSFLAALYASNIDVCRQSILDCPEGFRGGISGIKADVLLLPFGSDAPELLQFTSDMLTAINRQKVIVVSAAGNNQTSAHNFFPGGAPGIINVGSLNKAGERSHFSNYGPAVDIFAPGEKIDVSYPNGKKTLSGTSVAAAFTAGAISLMKSVRPDLALSSALYHLKKSASQISCDDYCQKDIIKRSDEKCEELCCSKDSTCNRLALTIDAAMKSVKPQNSAPIVEISDYYVLFTQDGNNEKRIKINNSGTLETNIKIISYDDKIVIEPNVLTLGQKGSSSANAEIKFSFKKEPYTRLTSKVEFIAEQNGEIFDRFEVYFEYVPKSPSRSTSSSND